VERAVTGGGQLHAHDRDDEEADEHVQRQHGAHVPDGDALHREHDEQDGAEHACDARIALYAQVVGRFDDVGHLADVMTTTV
jgi:hypothetical protein